jgi:hypothetical protein
LRKYETLEVVKKMLIFEAWHLIFPLRSQVPSAITIRALLHFLQTATRASQAAAGSVTGWGEALTRVGFIRIHDWREMTSGAPIA